ncbi:MAG: class I SAM-dependent methyltransferase [Acidimicrobiales bacterium]
MRTAAETFGPVFRAILGPALPVRLRYWDGSADGPDGGPGEVVFHSPRAMRRFLYSPDEVGLARAYSCARFVDAGDSLEAAQASKYDLICAKLGLAPGMRLLDVGCGWGTMAVP